MIYRALCSFSRIFNTRIIGHLVGMARCAVPARVQRAEHMLEDTRIAVPLAPLNAARTAQRAPLPLSLIDDVHIGQALPLSSFGGEGDRVRAAATQTQWQCGAQAVPARVQRAEHMLEDTRIAVPLARLNAARTAQRAVPGMGATATRGRDAGRPRVGPDRAQLWGALENQPK